MSTQDLSVDKTLEHEFVVEELIGETGGVDENGKRLRRHSRSRGIFAMGKEAMAQIKVMVDEGVAWADISVVAYPDTPEGQKVKPIPIQGKHIESAVTGKRRRHEVLYFGLVNAGTDDNGQEVYQVEELSGDAIYDQKSVLSLSYKIRQDDDGNMILHSAHANAVGQVAIQRDLAYQRSIDVAMALLFSD